MRYSVTLQFLFISIACFSQNTFPSSGSVGIGTTTPGKALEVVGDISLPSSLGNKQIYTWAANDPNWRIGMSASPGFTTSMATSHVSYLTYYSQPGQGFAVGVNGAQSSFEITGINHNAFFRGNVGIGTTSPGDKLDVVGNPVFGTATERLSMGSGAFGFNRQVATGNIYSTGGSAYQFQHTASSTQNSDYLAFQVYQPNGVQVTDRALVVNGSSNIGIGIITPLTKLHVNGAVRIDGASGGIIGAGSRIELSTGPVSIEENWGINLIGNDGSPVKIRNAALLVGYTSSSAGWGTGVSSR